MSVRRVLVVSVPTLVAAQNGTQPEMEIVPPIEDAFTRQRLILILITSSCVLIAVIIISVGVCFYKKYGGSHYGSGQIRILSEDGSVGEEVMYIFQTNGKVRRESASETRKSRGKSLGLFYADHQGNILSTRNGQFDKSGTPKIVSDTVTSVSVEVLSGISTDSTIVLP